MKKHLFVACTLAFAGVAFSELKTQQIEAAAAGETGAKASSITPSHRAALERLLVALQAEKNMEISMKAGAAMGMGLGDEQFKALPKAQREKIERSIKKAMDAISKELNWNSIKEQVIDAYGKTFSEKEALDICAIIESPAGKLLVSKQGQLAADLMRISQERMKTMMPKIASIIQEEMQRSEK